MPNISYLSFRPLVRMTKTMMRMAKTMETCWPPAIGETGGGSCQHRAHLGQVDLLKRGRLGAAGVCFADTLRTRRSQLLGPRSLRVLGVVVVESIL